MTIYIKNLKDLEGMIKSKIANELFFSSNLQDTVAEVMHEKIKENVYDAYSPTTYKRRGNSGGLLDMDNMEFTDVEVSNGQVKFTFENITEGNDTMQGQDLAPLIETGEPKEAWDKKGIWSQPRPFTESTAEALNENKSELTNALKKDLRNLGFDVK